jgi:predicted glycosyltransferase
MVDVWLDAATPKDALLIACLLPPLHNKDYKTIITAREQTQTTDILTLLNIPYVCVGKYGETLKAKLVEEQKRTLAFVKLFDRTGLPKVLWTHGDVSAARTAFGLQIPIVYSNDTPHAIHVAKLICPLVNWIVAPVSFGKSWSKFGVSKSKIALYNGVEELAWLVEPPKFRHPKFLEELDKKERVVLFRNVEYKASYCKDVKVDVWRLVKELSKMATVVYLPRYEEEKDKIKEFSNVWVPPKPVLAVQIIPYIDLMVGSGGTLCRETALMGIPTINFHFWDAPAKYLHKNSFPIQCIRNTNKIIKNAQNILKKPEKYRVSTKDILKELESPTPITVQYIEKCQKTHALS